jgi:hypothetical protein
MKKLKLRPFEISDAAQIFVRPEQHNEQEQADFGKWAKINKEGGPGYSAFYRDTLLFCAGVRIMWKGVGEAWAIFSKEITNFKAEAYVYTEEGLLKIMNENNLHRVQAHADEKYPLASKFLEGLGFKKECLMEKFQPNGNNSYLYALVR